MEFDDVVRRRRMVRSFDPDPVPLPALRRALRRAVRAPSAGFTQGWDAVVLTDAGDRDAFWEAATPEPDEAGASEAAGAAEAAAPAAPRPDRWLRGVRRAPCLVVVCSDPQAYVERYARPDKLARRPGPSAQDWPIPYWDVDAGMGALLLLLSGVDDGLGGLFFGVPRERHEHVRTALEVPADRRLVGIVALGYEADPLPSSAATADSAAAASAPGPSRRHRPTRRPLAQVVHDGRFGTTPTWLGDRPQGRFDESPESLSLFETEPWLRHRTTDGPIESDDET